MSSSDILAAIDAASRQLEVDMAAGDATALVANYYTEDPVVVAEGIAVFRGRTGAEDYFRGATAAMRACRLETHSVTAAGDGYFELGSVSLYPKDTGADPQVMSYAVVWRHEPDLGWRVAFDYFVPGRIGA